MSSDFTEIKTEFLDDSRKVANSRMRMKAIMDCKMIEMAEQTNMDWTLCFSELRGEMTKAQNLLFLELLRVTSDLTKLIERQMQEGS